VDNEKSQRSSYQMLGVQQCGIFRRNFRCHRELFELSLTSDDVSDVKLSLTSISSSEMQKVEFTVNTYSRSRTYDTDIASSHAV
jgi:hypothetical protein